MTQKENYIKELKTQLEKLRMKIEKLEADSDKVEANDQLALRVYINELRKKHDIAQAKLDTLFKETAEELWEELREGALEAINSLKKTFEKRQFNS